MTRAHDNEKENKNILCWSYAKADERDYRQLLHGLKMQILNLENIRYVRWFKQSSGIDSTIVAIAWV
jgi:hypothetical protein